MARLRVVSIMYPRRGDMPILYLNGASGTLAPDGRVRLQPTTLYLLARDKTLMHVFQELNSFIEATANRLDVCNRVCPLRGGPTDTWRCSDAECTREHTFDLTRKRATELIEQARLTKPLQGILCLSD